MKDKGLIFIIAVIVLILISLITAYNIILSKTQRAEVEKYLNYVNSKEVGEEVKTPKLMHVVLAAYKGEVKDLSIVKAITYFKINIITDIQNNTKNSLSKTMYYKWHKKQLKQQIGINDKEEYNQLVEKCNALTDIDKIDYIKFDTNTIKIDSNGLDVIMLVKCHDSAEVSFNVRILKKVNKNQTSIYIK